MTRPFLAPKHHELSAWYFGQVRETGVCLYTDIRPKLPKYYEALDNEAGRLIAAIESDNLRGADEALSRIKKLYGRAVDRLKEEMKRRVG